MSAGKGDKLRKGADLSKYRDNHDRIFKKPRRKKDKDARKTIKKGDES